MRRRRFVTGCGILGTTGLAGCLGSVIDGPTSDGTPTDHDDADHTPTTEPSDPEFPVDEPDAHLGIYLENHGETTHGVTITVTRVNGETVYEESHDAEPGTDHEVYNLQQADPEGVESFEVTAAVGDRSDAATVETSACYGNAIVAVEDDGEPFVTYSIC